LEGKKASMRRKKRKIRKEETSHAGKEKEEIYLEASFV